MTGRPEFPQRGHRTPQEAGEKMAAEVRAMMEAEAMDCARLYEELRRETDGGSESMTHADAIAAIRYLQDLPDYKHQVAALADALERACEQWEMWAEIATEGDRDDVRAEIAEYRDLARRAKEGA